MYTGRKFIGLYIYIYIYKPVQFLFISIRALNHVDFMHTYIICMCLKIFSTHTNFYMYIHIYIYICPKTCTLYTREYLHLYTHNISQKIWPITNSVWRCRIACENKNSNFGLVGLSKMISVMIFSARKVLRPRWGGIEWRKRGRVRQGRTRQAGSQYEAGLIRMRAKTSGGTSLHRSADEMQCNPLEGPLQLIQPQLPVNRSLGL